MKSKIVFNFYDLLDYKDFEQYVKHMVDKGWMVESITDRIIKFRPCIPGEFQVAIDFFVKPNVFDEYSEQNHKDYLTLCEASGWTFCCRNNRQVVFYAPKDHQTIPLQTEKNIEFEIVNRSIWKTEIWYTIFTLFIFIIMGSLLYFMEGNRFLYNDYSISIIFTVLLFLFVLLILRSYRYYTWLFVNKKNIKKNLAIKDPKPNYRLNIHIIFHYRSFLVVIFIISFGALFIEHPRLYLISNLAPLIAIFIYSTMPTLALFFTYKVTSIFSKVCINIVAMLLLVGAIFFQMNDTVMTQISSYMANTSQVKEMMEKTAFTKLDYADGSSSISTPFHYEIGLSQEEASVNIKYIQAKTNGIAQYFLNDYMTFQYQLDQNMAYVDKFGTHMSRNKPDITTVKQAFTPYSNPDWTFDEAYLNDKYFILRKDTIVFEITFPYQSFTKDSDVYNLIQAYYQSTLSK